MCLKGGRESRGGWRRPRAGCACRVRFAPMSDLIPPYGGTLIDLCSSDPELPRYAATLPSIQISARTQHDLELLATGAISPLDRFMGQRDYERVLSEMRLADGTPFPIPITLPVDDAPALHHDVALRSAKNELLAVMTVEEVYGWDPDEAARAVFGTTEARQPLVAEMQRWGKLNVSGSLRVLKLPTPPDFRELRRTPAEVRAELARRFEVGERETASGEQETTNDDARTANSEQRTANVVAF